MAAFSAHALPEFSGKITAFSGAHLQQQDPDVTQYGLGLETQLSSRQNITSNLRWQAGAWLKYDALNESPQEITQAELEELSIDWRRGGRRLKLGHSLRTWEGTDIINPMDVIHSKNWRDPLNSRPLSAPGVFYNDTFGNFSLDVTYLVRQLKSKLPGNNSPWLPRNLYLPMETNEFSVLLPKPLRYEVENGEELDDALSNNVALRLQYIGSSGDLSLAGFEGSASPPLLIPVTALDTIDLGPPLVLKARSPLGLKPLYYRQRVVAAAFTLTVADWIIRGAGHHAQPLGDDMRLPSWSQLGVIGIERTLYIKNQMLTLLFQAVASKRPDSDGLSMLSSLYENSYMLGVRWAPTEKWTWMQAFFQEQEGYSYLSLTDINWNYKDRWNLGLSALFFQGSPTSVLGTYSQNDQISLKASYSF